MSFSKSYYKREIVKICKSDTKNNRYGKIEGNIIENRFVKLIDKIMKDDEHITWDEFFNRCGLT